MLAVVVITRNEADRIAGCLASVAFADERLVLDAGSTDGTPEVAAAAGARVLRTGWPGFVAQRNRGLDETSAPWVLFLDADERLSAPAAAALTAALADPGDLAGASFARRSTWLGRPLRHGRWYPDRQLRLVRRGAGRWTGGPVHERLVVDGPVRRLAGDLLHDPYRDLGEHLATIDRYSRLSADALRAAGRRARPWDLALRPTARFLDAYVLRRGFLDGAPGLAVAGLGATHTLATWTRLYLEPPP